MIPPEENAAFVCAMEGVLELYHQPCNPLQPVVCFDEGMKQLISETRDPLATQPGQAQRYDYEYERHGTCNLFMFCEPLMGWRHIEVTDHKTMTDYAECLKYLVDVRYPNAECIHLVQDNFSTHKPSALYKAFSPQEARRILKRLVFHHTPKHGSWLNMAEIELSVLSRQCLDRRIGDKDTLTAEIAAWEAHRNRHVKTINWQFTTADARVKLKKLYPSFNA